MAKKRIILHIGFEKTGSKSIQDFCSKNMQLLNDNGLFFLNDIYHKLVFATTHWPLAAAFADSSAFVPATKRIAPDEAANLIREVAESTPLQTLVFSAEPLSSVLLSENNISALKHALSDFDVKIVAYIRRQDKFFISHVSTYVKGGFSFPLHDRITMKDTIISYDNQNRYNYQLILKRWENIFGLENILVRPFEPQSLLASDVVADFLNILGIKGAESASSRTRINESLSEEALLFLNLVNERAGKEFCHQYLSQLLPYLQKMPLRRKEKTRLISNQQCNEIIELYAKSNQAVAERYFVNRDKLFLEDLPDNSEPWEPIRPITHKEVVEILSAIERDMPGLNGKIISAICHVPYEYDVDNMPFPAI